MSTDWADRLRLEADRWVRLGLISAEQGEQILKLYPGGTAGSRDRTVMILSILGSLLVGAGVILYVAANWPRIPAGLKVAAILAAMLASYGAGYHLQFRQAGSPRLGQALIFLGSLLYGAGVWLIAQIFHLETDLPTGFLAWGAGILPVVWVTGSRPVLYLATGLLLIWTTGAQQHPGQYNPLFPLMMLGLVLPLARKTETRLPEAAVLLGLFLWHLLNLGKGDAEPGMVPVGQLALLYGPALFLAGLAQVGESKTYLASGGFLALLGAYLLTFAQPTWAPAPPPLFASTPYGLAGTLLLLGAVAVAAWLYGRRAEPGRSYLLPAALAPVAAVLLADWVPEIARLILFNLLLFGATLGLVAVGIQRRMALLLNLGLIAFGIHLLTRYFDLFFSAMDRALFFIFGGILLLAGGWLMERNRRRWMGDWGGERHDP